MKVFELIARLESALNKDAEIVVNTEDGEFEIQDVIVHYDEKAWIETVEDKRA